MRRHSLVQKKLSSAKGRDHEEKEGKSAARRKSSATILCKKRGSYAGRMDKFRPAKTLKAEPDAERGKRVPISAEWYKKRRL